MENPFKKILQPQQTAQDPTANSGAFSISKITTDINTPKKQTTPWGIKAKTSINSMKVYNQAFSEDLAKTTGNIFKDILQGTARTVATVGVEGINLPTNIGNTLTRAGTRVSPKLFGGPIQELPIAEETPTNTSPITNTLFGGKPIRTAQSAGGNAITQVNEMAGREIIKPTTKNKYLAGFAGIAIDLSGLGGGKTGVKTFMKGEVPEKVLKYFAKETNADTITRKLIDAGLDDQNAKILGEKFSITKTVDEAKRILADHGKATATENPFSNILKAPESTAKDINIASDINDLPITDIQKNALQALREGNTSQEVIDIAKTIDTNIFNKKTEQPYKETGNLTTKILKDLEGKTTVSKQYILDATNRGELKQVERDLIRDILERETPKTVRVWNKSKFSNEGAYVDLPVIRKEENLTLYQGGKAGDKRQFWTPDKKYAEQFGDVKEKTGAFYKVDNGNRVTDVYVEADKASDTINVSDFAKKVKAELLPLKRVTQKSVKYENIDLPDELKMPTDKYEEHIYESPIKTSAGKVHGFNTEYYSGHTRTRDLADKKTRQILEIQDDLRQKGNLEKEVNNYGTDFTKAEARYRENNGIKPDKKLTDLDNERITELVKQNQNVLKLSQYDNRTSPFRMVREEIKKASQDGKTKLQFPTGETAMKIEGLGDATTFYKVSDKAPYPLLNKDTMKVGDLVNHGTSGQSWIITDVLGDGKFKAVPKDRLETIIEDAGIASDSIDVNDWVSYAQNHRNIDLSLSTEQFDISGKVDTNNPIYKFYEKDVAKYLNKFGGKRIVDDKGVSWIEIPITKEQGKAPVEAFRLGSFGKAENTLSEVKDNLKKIFGKDIPVQIGGLSRADAMGEVSDATIKLLTENGKLSDAIAKHEALHFFLRHIATDLDRSVYKTLVKDITTSFPKKAEALKKSGYKDSEIAEEIMADEFARYYRTGKSFAQKFKIFFDRILQKMEMLFKGKTDILKYFKNIKNKSTGKLNLSKKGEAKFNIGDGKKISEADRLIAEGKIRVVSRNGRDTYQIKKAGEWTSVRDEDSAVRQLTRVVAKKPAEKPVLSQELEQKAFELEMKKEAIDSIPAKALEKFYDPRLGGIPEAGKSAFQRGTLRKASKWRSHGDEIAMDLGYADTEQAREAFDQYKFRKDELKKEIRDFNIQKAEELKKTKALGKMMKEEKKKEAIAFSEKLKQAPLIDTTTGEGRSLEIVAEQELRKLNEPMQEKVSSLPDIIKNYATSVNKKVNILDYIRTPDRVLKKIGFEKQAKMLHDSYGEYLKELPKNIDKITEWSKQISKERNASVFRWLDGEAVDLTPEELKVGKEIKAWLKEWADRLGIESEDRVTHYVTHIFDKELLKKEFDEDLAKLITDKLPGAVYNPFLLKRLGAKGYKQDTWQALDAYAKRATRKVHMDPVLEEIQAKAGSSLDVSNLETSQWKYLQNYINGVNMRPTELDNLIDNTIKNVVGYKYGQRPVTQITKTLRQMTYRGMLGLNVGSAMRNISQGINTYAVLGEKYTAIGYGSLFKSGSMAELKREGILNDAFIQDRVLSTTRKNLERLDRGLFVFFQTAEKINRGSAYFGAKAKALAQGKSEEDAVRYAKEVVRKTQFTFSPVDLPVALQSDIVKTLSQFSTYGVKQAEFLTEMAMDKNVYGLLRYALAGLVFVYTLGRAFGMEPKELIPNIGGMFGVSPSLKFPVEITKAVLDMPDKYGRPRDTKKKLSDIGSSGIGLIPAGVQAKKTIQGIKSVNDGGSFNKAGALQFKQKQTVPAKAQSIIFGKYASSNAKNFFAKKPSTDEQRVQKVYDKVQKLIKEGKTDEVAPLIKDFTEQDIAIYKKIISNEKRKDTLKKEQEMSSTVIKVQSLIKEGKKDEAIALVKDFTEEDIRVYKLMAKKLNSK